MIACAYNKTTATSFSECRSTIDNNSKKIWQGGYIWDLDENDQICKTSLCSNDSRFSSKEEKLQLWYWFLDAIETNHLIPNGTNSFVRSYSSNDLWRVEYILAYPYAYAELSVNVTNINKATLFLMTKSKEEPTIARFSSSINKIGIERINLNGVFKTVAIYYIPEATDSTVTFSLNWNSATLKTIDQTSEGGGPLIQLSKSEMWILFSVSALSCFIIFSWFFILKWWRKWRNWRKGDTTNKSLTDGEIKDPKNIYIDQTNKNKQVAPDSNLKIDQ